MSRLAFREARTDIAWQRQLRDRFAATTPAPPGPLVLGAARVRAVGARFAAHIILRFEWLGTMASTSHHYGLFFGDDCAGVCCYGTHATAGPYVHRAFGIEPRTLFTLARGACVPWAPPGANSKLVTYAGKLLHADTGAKLVLAYADPDAGEIGTIYQAANWTYIGRTSPAPEWRSPTGQVYNHKLPYDLRAVQGGTPAAATAALLRAGWTLQPVTHKYRYVYVLDRGDTALVRRVEALREPYPKRAGSILADAAGSQPAEDGSTPIPALHPEPVA